MAGSVYSSYRRVGSNYRLAYEFGCPRLEPAEPLLLRDGQPAPLTPKAFDLLVFLAQNQSRLIAKDEIMQVVWPDSFVEHANITVLLSALRKPWGATIFLLQSKMVEKSAEIDPTYAQTWGYLGQSYTSDAGFEFGGRELYRRAQAAYTRALALKPGYWKRRCF
jgi:hypothetical protein